MSCNPSIGGIGKGHLVKEVDALGGAMALPPTRRASSSASSIRPRARRCGPPARRPTACCTRQAIRRRLENQANLTLFQQAVDDLLLDGDRVVRREHPARHRVQRPRGGADRRHLSGRPGARRAGKLTRPGAHGRSARGALAASPARTELPAGPAEDRHAAAHRRPQHRFFRVQEQPGDDPAPVFSFLGDAGHASRASCPAGSPTPTRARTRSSAAVSTARPMFTGVIEGVGPRYCPSIEDKITRFADKASHQIFLEPEGLDDPRVYPNGISTWLPFDVQLAIGALDPGPGARAHPAPGLCDRVRLLRSAQPEGFAGDQVDRRPVFRRPDQWHHRLRRGRRAGPAWPASMPAFAGAGKRGLAVRAATKPIWACWSTT